MTLSPTMTNLDKFLGKAELVKAWAAAQGTKDFVAYLQDELAAAQRCLASEVKLELIYRLQGDIQRLEKLLTVINLARQSDKQNDGRK